MSRKPKRGYFVRGQFIAEGSPAPIDGVNDLNDAIVRRLRIQWLASGPKALDAAKLLGLA